MVFRYVHDGSSGRTSRVSEVRGEGIEGRNEKGEKRRGRRGGGEEEEQRKMTGGGEEEMRREELRTNP